MASEVTLEQVGSAEDVIQRLINEKRSLENAQEVLRVYRVVKSETAPAVAELDGVKRDIVSERKMLEDVKQQRVDALKKVNDEVEEYKGRLVGEAEVEIERVKVEIRSLEEEYADRYEAVMELKKRYDDEKERYEREVEVLKGELDEVRGQHTVLAEAIGRASQFFMSDTQRRV